MENETDKSCNDSKLLQDYMRHVQQQSHGRTTIAKKAAIYLTKCCVTFILIFVRCIAII